MPIVEHGNPIWVLQIVGGAEPVFRIAAVTVPPTSEPRAALGAAAVAQCKPLFQAPPIRLGADWQAEPGGPCFEVRVPDGASHFPLLKVWGVFGEYP
jgi:hypothetical protein